MKVLVILALLFIWLAISTWLGCKIGAFLDDGGDDGKTSSMFRQLDEQSGRRRRRPQRRENQMTWEPSKEAVERAAKVLEDTLGLIGSGVEIVARAALIAVHEDAAVLEGWKLVPIEPTVEMLREMVDQHLSSYPGKGPYPRSRAVYRAMLDAAPPAPETKK